MTIIRGRSLRRTFAAVAACVAVAAALVVAPGATSAARAADGDLLVSTDGVAYTTGTTLPLFAPSVRFVPGDVDSAQVWVKNAATTAGLLRVELINPATDDPLFASHLALSATPAGGVLQPVGFDTAIANGTCTVLSGTRVLAAGESLRLDIRSAVDTALTGAQGQQGAVTFALRATLVDAAAGAAAQPGTACLAVPDAGPTPPPNPGSLPHTGGTVPWTLVVLGALALGSGGFAFVVGRRRRRDDHEDTTPTDTPSR